MELAATLLQKTRNLHPHFRTAEAMVQYKRQLI